MFIKLKQYVENKNKEEVKNRLIYLYNQLSEVSSVSDEIFDTFIENDNTFLYLVDNIIVGCITLLIETKLIHNGGKVMHIEDLVIDKEYRNKGFGIKLMDLARIVAKGSNCYKIILDCNTDVKQFYMKNGFESKNMQMSLYF